MSVINRIVLTSDSNGVNTTGFSNADAPTIFRKLGTLLESCAQGGHNANVRLAYNPVAATGTITVGATGTNGDTLTLLGIVITMKTSGASAASNEINIGGSVTAVANQIVGLINGTTSGSPNSWAGMVSASNVAGVITITCLIPGVIGNVLLATSKSSTALTITHDIGLTTAGTEGTAKSLTLGLALTV